MSETQPTNISRTTILAELALVPLLDEEGDFQTITTLEDVRDVPLSRLCQNVKDVHNVNVNECLLSPFVSGKKRSHVMNLTSEHEVGYVTYYVYVKDPSKRVVIKSLIFFCGRVYPRKVFASHG